MEKLWKPDTHFVNGKKVDRDLMTLSLYIAKNISAGQTSSKTKHRQNQHNDIDLDLYGHYLELYHLGLDLCDVDHCLYFVLVDQNGIFVQRGAELSL